MHNDSARFFPKFQFEWFQSDHKGRLGFIETAHGSFQTPAFYFCATRAALKGLSTTALQKENTSILLSNTYHLMLRPGADIIQRQGGLHAFMHWDRPLFTDSGGFQIFSLGHGSVAEEIKGKNRPVSKTLTKISEEGASFRSYWDGSQHVLTPELSLTIQSQLGADFITVLDECTPFHASLKETTYSMNRSHRWALRSIKTYEEHAQSYQGLYGIIQGGVHFHLREESIEFAHHQPFFGHAIGGTLGDTKDTMKKIISYTAQKLMTSRPIHLLGIGGVEDIFFGVMQGIDTFDCVHPTRLARHGGALVRPVGDNDFKSVLNLSKRLWEEDSQPLEKDCPCETCVCYSRAYIHHLLKNKEILALTALTRHNVCFMNRLMVSIQQALRHHTWWETMKDWLGYIISPKGEKL
jgi:queuine tRNA-ribosyltransferase